MDEESNSNDNQLEKVVDYYSHILDKLKNLEENSAKEEYRKSALSDGAKYLMELVQTIEEHKDETMSYETAVAIEDGFRKFLTAIDNININDLLENETNFAYETFYLYINLLNLPSMIHFFQRLEMSDFVKAFYRYSIIGILHVITFAVGHSKFTINDLKEPFDNHQTLSFILNYVNYEFESDSLFTYSIITDLILSFLWNYADKTVLIPNLIQTGYAQAVINWLNIAYRQNESLSLIEILNGSRQGEKSKSSAVRPLISIVHNISRHDDGINQLNSLDGINIVKKVQSSTKDCEVDILCCMILALLSTPEQIKKDRKRMNNALDQLLQTVFNASKSKEYKDNGFHISEPLVVLVKLFNDDRALDYILQHAQVDLDSSSTLDFLIDLLIKYHNQVKNENDPLKQLTSTAIVNILWSISFQEHYQYKRQLKNNQTLVNLLEQFANVDQIDMNNTQYMSKYLETIQTAAQGILFNINYNTTITIDTIHQPNLLTQSKRNSVIESLIPSSKSTEDPSKENLNPKPMIMISYSHDDKILCYQIEEELKKLNLFDIWIDKNYCSTGDSWEHIAQGIKQSNVVLCLITNNYNSKSVRREIIYAIDKLDKPVLPVFVLKPNIPEWLDIRTCDLTYIRFNDEKQLDKQKTSKLIETLQKLISPSKTVSESPPIHYEPNVPILQTTKQQTNETFIETCTITNLSEKNVDQWNKSDIKQWFQQNEILPDLYQLFQFNDGTELFNFAKLLLEDEKNQYKIYSQEFSKLYDGRSLLLHHFNKFSSALRKLNHQQTPIGTQNKSQTCNIL